LSSKHSVVPGEMRIEKIRMTLIMSIAWCLISDLWGLVPDTWCLMPDAWGDPNHQITSMVIHRCSKCLCWQWDALLTSRASDLTRDLWLISPRRLSHAIFWNEPSRSRSRSKSRSLCDLILKFNDFQRMLF
jgi:hypothetical protein